MARDFATITHAAKIVHDFMRDHEHSDKLAGYAACPECLTVFAGFRIHAEGCSIGEAADAARLLFTEFGAAAASKPTEEEVA